MNEKIARLPQRLIRNASQIRIELAMLPSHFNLIVVFFDIFIESNHRRILPPHVIGELLELPHALPEVARPLRITEENIA
jgi:hypothetical protein